MKGWSEWRLETGSYIFPPRSAPSAQRPAVHLARPVVDPERPRVAEDALDHRVADDAHAVQDPQQASLPVF